MAVAYFTAEELAERWRMSITTFREYRRNNPVPTVRLSKRKALFPVAQIEKYEQNRMLKGA